MTDDLRPWTYQEAADWFNRDVVTIRRWVREGKLERLEVNGLITAESVRRLSTLPAQRSEDYHAPRDGGRSHGPARAQHDQDGPQVQRCLRDTGPRGRRWAGPGAGRLMVSDTDLTHWQASQIAARDAMLYGLGAVGFNNADHPMAYYRIPPSSVFLVPPDSLDAAWAEAEAALPEGWAFDLSRAVRPPAEGAAPTYYATVSRPWTTGAIEFQVSGPTPAAALRALAAKLREAKG